MKRTRVRTLLVALAATLLGASQLMAQATGEIRGVVIDNSMMAPLNEVTIEVAGQTVLSSSQGTFVVQDVPVGVHTLTASLLGYRPFETQVTVTAGTTTEVEVRLAVAPLEMDPIVAVGYVAHDQRQQHHRQELHETEEPEVQGAARQSVQMPADGHALRGIADRRRYAGKPEQGKGWMPEQRTGRLGASRHGSTCLNVECAGL